MNIFLARQPIFDKDENVVGYELLFRDGLNNSFPLVNGNLATMGVINNSYLMGFDSVTAGKRAFINFTQDLLGGEVPLILPKDRVVVEILEDVQSDPKVIATCKRLKKWGYMLALDDYSLNCPGRKDLLEIVDYVKVDFLINSELQRKAIIKKNSRPSLQFLAEKVETRDDFKKAIAVGYSLFQGYFFSKPEVLTYRNIAPDSYTCLQVLDLLNKPDWDYAQLAEVIERDVAFSFKLLRYINSAAVGLRVRIKSIKQALVLLGNNQVRRFILLNILSRLAQGKPEVLTVYSVFRARFAELLVKAMGLVEISSDLYLSGLFSMIDAILERPMPEVLKELPLTSAVKEALLGNPGLYRNVLELVIAYERGDWKTTAGLLAEFNLDEGIIPTLYEEAVQWGDLCSKII